MKDNITALSEFIIKRVPEATIIIEGDNSRQYLTKLLVILPKDLKALLGAIISKMSIEQFNKIKNGEELQ